MSFRNLMVMLTDKRVFVMRDGERYFFAKVVGGRGASDGIIDPYAGDDSINGETE